MRKSFVFITVIIVSFFICPLTANADFGPKPSITVEAKNMPDTICYMDLLVESREADKGAIARNFGDTRYDQNLINILRNYDANGWRASVVNDLYIIHGSVICNIKDGKCTLRYGYRVPDKFKIIVAYGSGDVVVSNVVERKAFNSVVYFDFESTKASERVFPVSYLLQFVMTCLATLILEGFVLLLFGFGLKENLKPFLYINIATQLLLTMAIFYGMYFNGSLAALFLYALSEFIIFFAEAILFAKLIRQHSKARRVLFSITANFVSLLTSTAVILLIDRTAGW